MKVLSLEGATYTVMSTDFEATHTVTIEQLRPAPAWFWDLGGKTWLIRGHEDELHDTLEAARSAT